MFSNLWCANSLPMQLQDLVVETWAVLQRGMQPMPVLKPASNYAYLSVDSFFAVDMISIGDLQCVR